MKTTPCAAIGVRLLASKKRRLLLLFSIVTAAFSFANNGLSQTAVIDDAWWSYQQDCNGDGCKAGTLPGGMARLNWNSDVINCNGTLTVFEKIFFKQCGSNTWTAIYTNSPHSITGCRSSDSQHLDIAIGSGCICRDYKIEVYRNGQTNPDYIRSSTNDVDLAQHREQLLSADYCLSDTFATCASLSGNFGSQFDNNAAATKEAGEPNHAGNAGGKSLWYCWTAPTNKPVTIDTMGSSFDTLLAVYTGNTVSSLAVIASNDDIAGASNRQSRVTFTPVTGTTYRIAVDGFGGASGIIALNWNQSGSALPDLIFWGPAISASVITRTFASGDCEVVEGCETVGTKRLLSFTTETRNIGTGDLIMGDPSTNSLFEFASCHGHYHFEQFAQYSVLDTNGNIVALGHKVGFCLVDDHPWSPTANAQAKYTCGFQGIQAGWADVYGAGLPCQYVDITGVPAGDYVLKMEVNPEGLIPESNTNNNVTYVPITIPPTGCTTAPANDNFANATTVIDLPFSISEFNNCATKQSGEPNHAGNAGGHSVWFNWTPNSNQTAVITTRRSDFNTLLGVYTGSNVSLLTRVATNDDVNASILQSQVSFSAVAGTTYRIVVDGFGGAVGTVVLNVNPPGNDDFSTAYLLSGTSGATNGYTTGASKEPGEPAHAFDVGGHSIWYRWTAPISGPVEFSTKGSSFDTTLAVYTGNNLTNLTMVAANNDEGGGALTSRAGFDAVAGTTYRIAIDGSTGDSGNIVLNWNMDSRLSISKLVDGEMEVDFTGVTWQRYTLVESTNLLTWATNTSPITMTGGSHSYTNNGASQRRFFRVLRSN